MKDKITDIKDYGLFDDFKILMVNFLSNQPLRMDKLENIYKNHPKTSRTPLKDIIQMLNKLDLIDIEQDSIKVNALSDNYKQMRDHDMKKSILTKLLERICEEDATFNQYLRTTYDPHLSCYVLKHKFPIKYSAIRNMLLQYSVLLYSDEVQDVLIVDNEFVDLFTKFTKKTTSQTELDVILENKKEAGNFGEEFVIKYEKGRIDNQKLAEKIIRISLSDVSAGFDILSFESNDSKVYDRFIEVKTHSGNGVFYWSRNEIDVSKRLDNQYYLYLVNLQKIDETGYEPEIILNPYKSIYESNKWSKTTELISVRSI